MYPVKALILLVLSAALSLANICGEYAVKHTNLVYATCVDWASKKGSLPGIGHLPDCQTIIWVHASEGDAVKFVIDGKTYLRDLDGPGGDKISVLVLDSFDHKKVDSISVLEEKK